VDIQVVDVRELKDTFLGNAKTFQGTVSISAPAVDGVSTGQFNPTQDTALNLSIVGGSSVWFTVTPVSSPDDVVTLENIDTTQSPNVTLYVAQSRVVEDVLAGLTQVVRTESKAAQVLVSFVNSQKTGVAGVAVRQATAGTVLHSNGGIWSTLGPTDGVGQVLLVNVPALDTAGDASLTYTVSGADAGAAVVNFPVLSGALTLLRVPLE
jgi:hypothetical protein